MLELGVLDELLHAKNEVVWANSVFKLAESLGFTQVLYGITQDRRLPLLENVAIRSNYSPSWRSMYDSESLVNVDPTVTHTLKKRTPVIWEPTIIEAPKQQQLFEEAASFGIKSGISYPIHGKNHEWGIMSFATDRSSNKEFAKDLSYALPHLSLLRDYAFESGKKFFKPAKPEMIEVNLTPKEVECLSWAMEGKTSWEIGMISGRSENTVNFHFKSVMSKLNVSSRQEAMIKAIKMGFIQL